MPSNALSDFAGRHPVARFIDVSLRGASQVFFQNNPVTGLIVLAAIFWGGYAAGNLDVGLGAILGLVGGTAMAVLLAANRAAFDQGLFGFNGILVGAAVPTFLAHHPLMWAYVVIGAAVSTVVTLAIANVVRTWAVPGSTAPFVITTWLLMLASYSFASIPIAAMGPPALPAVLGAGSQIASDAWFGILAKNISQVYLLENVVTGLLFVIAIAVSSIRGALFAVLGSVVSLIVAVTFGAKASAIGAGLFGFSAVLTAMAVGAVFNQTSIRVTLYAALATVFTVIVQAAMDTALAPLGIPTLTFPYVLTMWLFLLPKADLAPHPHHLPVSNGVLAKTR